MNKYKVYMHICPNDKKYIGITQQDVLKRWNYGNGYKGCVLFYKAIKKYGWKNIKHIILFDNLEKNEAEKKEKELIKECKTNDKNYGYNICLGGNGTPNHYVSEEVRLKISKQTKKAMEKPNVKEKIRKCHLGKTLSEEHKMKIRTSLKKEKTEETKLKMRKANKTKVKVKCLETGIVYDSIHDASRITNIAYQNIYKACKNIRKKAGGYCWKYEY
jgi:group I intron endonuclease